MITTQRERGQTRAWLYGKQECVFTGYPSDSEIQRAMYSIHAQKLDREAYSLEQSAKHKRRAAAHIRRHYVE